MSHTHDWEDYWATGYDKCLDCGATRKSISMPSIPTIPKRILDSNISITLYLSTGEVIEHI